MLTPPMPGAHRVTPVRPDVAARLAADQARRSRKQPARRTHHTAYDADYERMMQEAPRG